MIYTVIIILIVSLVLLGVIVNAFQQQKNKIETERRAELSKQKEIIDNTETALISAEQIPISQRIVFVMRQRILAAIKVAKSMGDKTIGSNARVKMAEDSLKAIDVNKPPPSEDSFQLPQGDKQVIQFYSQY
jgi:Na+-transporting NADH:ubiquinone oxidoreductase subunit NqrC